MYPLKSDARPICAALKPNSVIMTTLKSDFLKILTERGFIHQCSDLPGVDALAASGKLVAYVGYDCTAPSLHVGSLLSIMMLHWMQTTNSGKPIALMGGGTTRVGDPSGKDETRQLRTIEEIDANKNGLKAVFAKLLTFGDKPAEAVMVDNAEWLAPLNYIDFLRDVGRHFSVNRMLSMDSAKMRLEREQELSFIEFNYMLLQAYDFVELCKRYGCNLQMGGSDQWGNIVTGSDLGRRMGVKTPLHALTCPLLTTSSGAKMGKTAAGAVWLNEEQLSAYDYWQYWRNTEDADVGRFLKLFTTLPMDEIARLEALEGAQINDAKKILATEATALIHGRTKADAAAKTAQQTFEEGKAAVGLPVYTAPIGDGLGILNLFVAAGLATSNSEVRKAIANNSVSINDTKITDPTYTVAQKDLIDGQAKLSLGKKKHVLLKPA
jgi:tyrosyl-tRNA synthetase